MGRAGVNMKKLTLNDGNQIPCMGFGCYNAFGDEIVHAICHAVEAGYRYIDSAAKYGNETSVGDAIAQAGVSREKLFILSKAWPSSYDDLEAAAMQTLKDLKVEYLDAYLLHWPGLDETRRLKAYEQLLKLKEKGICRTAATSNFLPDQLDVVAREFGAYPPINELERHPSYQQRSMTDFCKNNGIQTVAYSPINRSNDLRGDTVRAIAEKYGKTPGQVVLRWHLEGDYLPIPKSSNPARIRENIDIFDFSLTKEEVEAIDALECGARSGLDPLVIN